MKNHHDTIGCEEAQRLICERSERTLSLAEAEIVADAIDACAECERFFQLHDEVIEAFIASHESMVEQVEAKISDDFTDRVLAQLPNLQQTESPHVRGTEEHPLSRVPTTTTTTPEPHARGRGTLRRFPVRAAMAAAAILIVAVVGLRVLSPSGRFDLHERSGAVVLRTASTTTWHPAADHPQLADGDTLYVCPNDTARLELADGVVARLGGDTMVELLAAGPRVHVGTVSVENVTRGPHLFLAGTETVEVAPGAKVVITVHTPARSASETTVWVRGGNAVVTRGGDEITLAAGENRVFAGTLPPHALPADELTAMRGQVERIDQGRRAATMAWMPPVEQSLRESAAAAIAGNHGYDRAIAMTVAGRLGFTDVIDQAPDSADRYDAAYRRALVDALARHASPERVTRIERMLEDRDATVRAEASEALGTVNELTPNTAAKLREIAKTGPTVHERLAAAVAVTTSDAGVTAREQAKLAADARRADALDTIKSLKPRAYLRDAQTIQRVAGMMVDPTLEENVREQAYTMLLRLGDPSTAASFAKLLEDDSARMRKFALTAARNAQLIPESVLVDVRGRIVAIARGETGAAEKERKLAIMAMSQRKLADTAILSSIMRQTQTAALVRIEAAKATRSLAPRPAMTWFDEEIRLLLADADNAPVAGELIKVIGQYGNAGDKAKLLGLLDSPVKLVVSSAIQAIGMMSRRSIGFETGEVDRLQRLLRSLGEQSDRRRVRRVIAGHKPKAAAYRFLQQEIQQPKTVSDLLDTLHVIGSLKINQAGPELIALLRDERDVVAARAANTLVALDGAVAAKAIPHILQRYQQEKQTDARLNEDSTFDLAQALLRLGEIRVSLSDLTRAVHEGWMRGGDAAQILHNEIALPSSSSILVQVRDVDDPSLRYRVAKLFFAKMSRGVVNTVRRWYRSESDAWTRFILAAALMRAGDREPIVESLIRYREESQLGGERTLTTSLNVASFDEAIAIVKAGQRDDAVVKALELVVRAARPGASRLAAVADQTIEVTTCRARYVDRIRSLRRDLCSTDPARRAAGATRAKSLMDRALVPVLIHLLADEEIKVRRASAETLRTLGRSALSGYAPESEGDTLRDQVRAVRERLDQIDLDRLIDRPLPLRLAK